LVLLRVDFHKEELIIKNDDVSGTYGYITAVMVLAAEGVAEFANASHILSSLTEIRFHSLDLFYFLSYMFVGLWEIESYIFV